MRITNNHARRVTAMEGIGAYVGGIYVKHGNGGQELLEYKGLGGQVDKK